MKDLNLIKGPHVLFRGTNGLKTPGITVEIIGPKSEVEDRGFSRRFDINMFSLQAHPDKFAERLGLPSLNKMLTDLEKLARPSTAKEIMRGGRYEKTESIVPWHLCELAKKILWHGPACGGNEVELSHLAPELAALVLVHFGKGEEELELEE